MTERGIPVLDRPCHIPEPHPPHGLRTWGLDVRCPGRAEVCGVTLTYDPKVHRSNRRLIASHGGTHACKLDAGHPASGPGYVPVHQCRDCTLCWESEPRPVVHCTCQAGHNPACPTHGQEQP